MELLIDILVASIFKLSESSRDFYESSLSVFKSKLHGKNMSKQSRDR